MESPDRERKHRGKRLFFAIVLATVAVVAGLLLTVGSLLFGPNPPIVVSKQTTYITSPLRADGSVDYEEWIRRKWRGDATPETNGAIPFWKAMWGIDLDDPAEQELICQELGMEAPQPEEVLKPLENSPWKERVEDWLRTAHPKSEYSDFDEEASSEYGTAGFGNSQFMPVLESDRDAIVYQSIERPWTRKELPLAAEWVDANERAFELLHQAAVAPHFYTSSPTLANSEQETLVEILLPGLQGKRTAVRALNRRSMMLLGEGQLEESWEDLNACYRLGRHVENGITLIHLFIGYAVENMANECVYQLLESEDLDAELARNILSEYLSLTEMPEMLNVFAEYERLYVLDTMSHLQHMGREAFIEFDLPYIPFCVDWNVGMVDANALYDLIGAAAKAPRGLTRDRALQKVQDRFGLIDNSVSISNMRANNIATMFGRDKRSLLIGREIMQSLLPSFGSMDNAEKKHLTQRSLTQLAIALKVYQIEQGDYPESLDKLVPDILPKLPVDSYQLKPYVYRKTEDGYLLYSVGANGLDDGGSNVEQNYLEGKTIKTASEDSYYGGYDSEAGEWVEGSDPQGVSEAEKLLAKIPPGADDLPLRMPLPAPEPWPWERGQSEEAETLENR